MSSRTVLWLIILLTIFSVLINLPAIKVPGKIKAFGKEVSFNSITSAVLDHFPIKLGLDLQGGTELVLQTQMDKIDKADRDSALESARQVIERRVNFFGVSESVVQSSKLGEERRILVELPGVSDTNTALQLVGKTAQLDFREFISSPSGEASLSGSINPSEGKPTGLTGADLRKAQVTFGSSRSGGSGPQVAIEFNDKGAQKFAEITKRNVGKPLGMYLDGVPITWPPPVVQQEIIGGNAVISGNFTTDEAKNLAIQLNAGALPVPIKILQQRQIAPTLGSQSIQKSVVAGAIGIVTVIIFMIAYYGLYGLLADLALIVYTLVVLTIFRTGFFIMPPVTLTLAGIAGLILSIGMAVDANILTFERMKEELRSGKSGKAALEAGFIRSWTSIRDSNISSLITALILYVLGTTVVRGFAVTLAIGVLVSMFSAIVVTRTFLRMLPRFRR